MPKGAVVREKKYVVELTKEERERLLKLILVFSFSEKHGRPEPKPYELTPLCGDSASAAGALCSKALKTI